MSYHVRITPKLVEHCVGGEKSYSWYCPGCKEGHTIPVPRWTFDGNVERPTFSPSILRTAAPSDYRCHSFVENGQIRFCGDCNHALAGQTVDMVDFPETYDPAIGV